MTYTAGIDIGSTYTKVVVANERNEIVGRAFEKTGFRLAEAAQQALERAMAEARVTRSDVAYVVGTGFGRHQVDISDAQVTDLTAASRGACGFFPNTRT
ncbi:MAG TPA: BadF/BadG/BcrA/BcrD ATPase family protein, partial [Longimicrobiales bacterium]